MYAAPPMMNLTVIRSPDIDRAATFYQAMGLLFTEHRHGSGPLHYTSAVNGFVFEIYPRGKHPPTTSTRIGFSVDEVDSVVEMLLAVGGTLLSPPTDSEWGRRAVMKDLDGHTVELLTPADRDQIVASTETSTGVITKTHSSGMNPGDCDRR
ncbi:VOC family protein [Lignipirellula cremea]|uniref:Glyoxalase-like domain protein n=1 Tax=Lignipirellula cremea TaxID=2528010 RepID=A0A518DVM0_9BACT|nr:VOC family protein [Lignipirellula cremea]QDU95879.1 Glyoxalase-like domain protein [Lignipirellula cremea]